MHKLALYQAHTFIDIMACLKDKQNATNASQAFGLKLDL